MRYVQQTLLTVFRKYGDAIPREALVELAEVLDGESRAARQLGA